MSKQNANCPWPRDVVRSAVDNAIGSIGGPKVFRFVGPDVRRAVIRSACWNLVHSAVSIGSASTTLDAPTIVAIEREFFRVAGIAEENGWDAGVVKAVSW